MKIWKRILTHVGFWVVYFSINLFNELYLSYSFTVHPSKEIFFDSLLAQALLLVVKVPAVYYVLYSLIPRWLKKPAKAILFLEVLVATVLFLTSYRLLIHLVIWPVINNEVPESIPFLQYLARCFYSLFDILQVVGIAAAIKLFRLRLDAIKKEKLLLKEKMQSEIQHLKSQLNPHFLFNTLNSIYALTRSHSDEASSAVMRLSKILRYMLYETEKRTTSIEEEIKIMEDYIELQQLRFGKRITVSFEKEIDNYSATVTPLLILPLIENSFKHSNGEIAAEIKINIMLKDNHLTVGIKNPVSVSNVQYEKEAGIGLANIGRQLELLYREYRFDFKEMENIFIVDLQINLSSYAGYELFDSRR